MITANARPRGHDALLFNPGDARAIEGYLLARRLATPEELPARIARAGDGNMNLTLRVSLRGRSVILKQGRPWVEKYPQIAAPWGRTLVEAAFYRTTARFPAVSARLPALLHVDDRNHILVLEDLGNAADLQTIYARHTISSRQLDALTGWLDVLHRVPTAERKLFANRAMRQLNHEHIFRVPLLRPEAEFEAIVPGLSAVTASLRRDATYRARVGELGLQYLSDGPRLVHGDFFPGSWLRHKNEIRIIDPEFCFLGRPEFDYGVMLAHLILARVPRDGRARVLGAARAANMDLATVRGFAGVEIMRRVLGVARLPLALTFDDARELLSQSLELVCLPARS